ncbi:hypothetical protein WAI453_008736 [Rhynchosporium graminicola]
MLTLHRDWAQVLQNGFFPSFLILSSVLEESIESAQNTGSGSRYRMTDNWSFPSGKEGESKEGGKGGARPGIIGCVTRSVLNCLVLG